MTPKTHPEPATHPHPPAPARSAWWRHPRARTTFQVTLGVVGLAVVVWFFFFLPFVTSDDARVAATTVNVSPPGAGGLVVKINGDEGTRIAAGGVLIELDHRTAEAQLQRAQARYDLAQKELARLQQMAAANGVAPRDLDSARANAATAGAELRLAEVSLDNTFLRSPTDGIVIHKSTEVGDILEPGQPAMTVADLDHAWVAANIEETSLGRVHMGQRVTIHVDEGGRLHGKVSEIRAATAAAFALIPADNPQGNFTKLVQRIPIKVALDPHPGWTLHVGQSVEVRIHVR